MSRRGKKSKKILQREVRADRPEAGVAWWIPVATIIGVVGVVYVNTLVNGFVWDDVSSIQHSPLLHSIGNIPRIFSEVMLLIYRPLTYSSFVIIYELFGGNAFFFHLLNVSVHAGVSLLVFALFRRFFSLGIALGLAIVFAVHPGNVEAVTWISAYSEVSYVLYGLLAFLFLLRATEGGNISRNYMLMTFFLVLSYLSKESAMIISMTMAWYVFLYHRSRLLSVVMLQLLPFFSYISLRFLLTASPSLITEEKTLIPIQNLPFASRLLHVPAIIMFYVATFFVPLSLRTQQYWTIPFAGLGTFFLPLVGVLSIVAALTAAGFLLRKAGSIYFKPWLFFSGWVVCWLVFHIQLFPLTMTVAERWFYFGIIGALGLIGVGVQLLTKKSILPQQLVVGIGIVAIVLLSVRTIVRNTDWKDNMTLYSRDYRYEDANSYLENSLGAELSRNGRVEEAYPHYLRSVTLAPDGWINWTNLGTYYQGKGEYGKALTAFKTALVNRPEYVHAYYRLSYLQLVMGDLAAAKKTAIDGLEKHPENARLLRTYALILYKQGEQQDAIRAMTEAFKREQSNENASLLQTMQSGEMLEIH